MVRKLTIISPNGRTQKTYPNARHSVGDSASNATLFMVIAITYITVASLIKSVVAGYFKNTKEAEQYHWSTIFVSRCTIISPNLVFYGLAYMMNKQIAPYVTQFSDVLYPIISKITPAQIAAAGPALSKMGLYLPSFSHLPGLILFVPTLVEFVIQHHDSVFEEMAGADKIKKIRSNRRSCCTSSREH